MFIFKNFIIVVILVGIITRISNYFFYKKIFDKKAALYVSIIISGIITCSIASAIVGFDIVISEYVISFIMWFIFDLIRLEVKRRG